MLKRNIVANYLGTAWTAIMSIAFVPMYVRYLGTEAYGVIGISAVIGTFLSFFDLGLSPMLSREMARYRGGIHAAKSIRSLLRVVELCSWPVGLLGMVALWFAAPWLASGWLRSESLSPDTIAHAMRIMAAVIGLRFVEGMYRGVLMGLQRQVTVNAISMSAATLRGAGSMAVLAWWSPTLDAFFWWQGVVAVLSLASFVACGYSALPCAPVSLGHGIGTLRLAWPFAKGILLGNLLGLGLGQTDKLLLSRLLELFDYGEYVLAVTVASCASIAAGPICQALYPRLTERHARTDGTGFVAEFHRMAQLVSVAAGGTGMVLVVFADVIMLAWTSDPRLASAIATPVRLLGIGGVLSACAQVLDYCQLASGRTRLRNCMNGVAMAAVVPALLVVAPSYGKNGAAAVWLGLNVGYICVYAPLSLRALMPNEIPTWWRRDLLTPLFTALIVCLAARAIYETLPPDVLPDGLLVAISIGLSLSSAALAAPIVRAAVLARIRPLRRHLTGG
jgi:O-antigen/teichoic acid export membrane protein